MKKIKINLNGTRRIAYVDPNDTLLEALREKFGIKSAKCGCDRGDCGACTVFYDGKSVKSCNILAIEADGHQIDTIEGLSVNGLNELQKKFIEFHSFQCGYCAPGVTIAATELLNNNPNPSLEEIKEALSGNLCRCTGYTPIIDAILDITKKG